MRRETELVRDAIPFPGFVEDDHSMYKRLVNRPSKAQEPWPQPGMPITITRDV